MKVQIYMDVYPWSKPQDVYLTTQPYSKMSDATRYLIEVEIPDPAKPDATMQAEAVEVSA